jgi:hypothetical protein
LVTAPLVYQSIEEAFTPLVFKILISALSKLCPNLPVYLAVNSSKVKSANLLTAKTID